MKAGGTKKAAERRYVFTRGSSLRRRPGGCRGGVGCFVQGYAVLQSLAYVRNAAREEAAPVYMLAPACPHVFYRSRCIRLPPVCRRVKG